MTATIKQLLAGMPTRAICNTINHYMQPYICEDLSVSFECNDNYHFRLVLKNIVCSPEVFNKYIAHLGLPFIINELKIASISIDVMSLKIIVSGLNCTFITQEPKDDPPPPNGMDDSSSDEFIQSFDENLPGDDRYKDITAEEYLNKLFTALQDNLDLTFEDISVRLENVSMESSTGIAVEAQIKQVRLFKGESDCLSPDVVSRRVTISEFFLYTDETKIKVKDLSSQSDIGESMMQTSLSDSLFKQKIFSIESCTPIMFASMHSLTSFDVSVHLETCALSVSSVNPADLAFFATPRQIFLLVNLAEALTPNKNSTTLSEPTCTPLTKSDFFNMGVTKLKKTVLSDFGDESELDSQSIGSITLGSGICGWSGPRAGNFQSGAINDQVFESTCNSAENPDYAQSVASDCTVQSQSCASERSYASKSGISSVFGQMVEKLVDPKQNIESKFVFKFNSIVAVVLHEDLLAKGGEATYDSLQSFSKDFFISINYEKKEGILRDISSLRSVIQRECRKSHFQITASNILIDISRREVCSRLTVSSVLKVHQLEVVESLVENETLGTASEVVEVLVFENDSLLAGGNPCITISYNMDSEIRNKSLQRCDFGKTESKASVALANCTVEVDPSVVDRAEAFFNPPTFFNEVNSNLVQSFHSSYDSQPQAKSCSKAVISSGYTQTFRLSVSASSANFRLRFPIPDLRSTVFKSDKEPWKRNIRNDVLSLKLKEVRVNHDVVLPRDNEAFSVKVESDGLELYFQEGPEEPCYTIGLAKDPKENTPVHIVINCCLEGPSQVAQTPLVDDLEHTLMQKYDCRPFFKAEIAGQEKGTQSNVLLYPASRDTFARFLQTAFGSIQCHVCAQIPILDLRIPSKHIYEVLYNRIAYDLLLWTPHSSFPSKTKNKSIVDPTEEKAVNVNDYLGDSMTGSIYHSFRADDCNDELESFTATEHDNKFSSSSSLKTEKDETPATKQKLDASSNSTMFGATIKVGQLYLLVNTPYKNESGNVVPDLCGKLMIVGQKTDLQVSVGHQGDPNTTYLGIFMSEGFLAHSSKSMELHDNFSVSKKNIVFSKNGLNYFKKLNQGEFKKQDMLSLVMQFDFDIPRNASTMTLAGKLGDALYEHQFIPDNETWFKQLVDAVSVQDYPISGYEVPQTINDIHFTCNRSVFKYSAPAPVNRDIILSFDNLIFGSCMSYECDVAIVKLLLDDFRVGLSANQDSRPSAVFHQILHSELMQFNWRKKETRTATTASNIPKDDILIIGNLVRASIHTDTLRVLYKLNAHVMDMLTANSSASSQNSIQEDTVDVPESEASSDPNSRSSEYNERVQELIAEALRVTEKQKAAQMQREVASFTPLNFPDDAGYKIISEDVAPRQEGVGKYEKIEDSESSYHIVEKPDVKPLDEHSTKIFADAKWHRCKVGQGKNYGRRRSPVPDTKVVIKNLSIVLELCPGAAFERTPFQDQTIQKSSSVAFNAREGRLSMNPPRVPNKMDNSRKAFIKVCLKKIGCCVEFYPEDSNRVSSYLLTVKNIDVLDEVPNSKLNKLFCRYESPSHPTPTDSDFVRIGFLIKRERDEDLVREEAHLSVSMGNIRMYVDQAAVTFLTEFFAELNKWDNDSIPKIASNSSSSAASTARVSKINDSELLFFKSVVFKPAISIIIDFEGNFSDARSVVDFIVAMGSASKVKLRLKEISFKRGFLGFHRVIEYIKNQWSSDIYDQKMTVVTQCVAPVAFFLDFVDGIWQFVESPFRHYMKDGNVLRGLILGSRAFTYQSLSATFGLLARFLGVMEKIASFMMVVVSRSYKPEAIQGPPPQDIREGYDIASNLMRETVSNLREELMHSYETESRERGIAGAVSGLGRNIPAMLVAPTLMATQATGCLVSGIQNQCLPGSKEDTRSKYKS